MSGREVSVVRIESMRLAELEAKEAELAKLRHAIQAARISYGARDGEALLDWTHRIYRGHQRWLEVVRLARHSVDNGEVEGG